ncbi:MAG: hypothetical protein MRY79_02940 [Alphaproteobacteria bacterium]|nr:hypothetical protein [Alphaproteobacteria bacterium]
MKYLSNSFIYLILLSFFVVTACEHEEKRTSESYLEYERHLQIPQWAHEDWYAEDWTSKKKGMDLVQDFYKADIFRDQVTDENGMPVLIVGPNFYHLSGYDKRRVVHVLDVVYGLTASKTNGSFYLQDWHSEKIIGSFDRHGLRLH